MKVKVLVIILVVACVALGVGLIVTHNKALAERQELTRQADEKKQKIIETETKVSELELIREQLTNNLSEVRTELIAQSNRTTEVSAHLQKTQEELAKTQEEAKKAAEMAAAEMAKRDARISDLEGQNDSMTKKMVDLNTSLVGLEAQIAETKKKLDESKGENAFLVKELKRLQAEKAELERQFNDLAILREQVRKLKDELSAARRLEWIRSGIIGGPLVKGGERLNLGFKNRNKATNTAPSLDVELRSNGTTAPAPINPGAAPAPAPVPAPAPAPATPQ